MLLLGSALLGLERSGNSLHRLLQYPQADEEALPSSVPAPQGEDVGLHREGHSEDGFVIKTTNLFQPSTPGLQYPSKTGQNQPRKHSGNRNAGERISVGGVAVLPPHSHDRSQPPGKAVRYTKLLRRRDEARVDDRRGQRAAPGAHSRSQRHATDLHRKHAHGPTSSTGRASRGPANSRSHGPSKSPRHRRFSDAELWEKRLPEQRDRMEPPSNESVTDAMAQNSATMSPAEKAAAKAAEGKAAAEAKERAQPGWADNIERAGETKESKVPLGTMQHAWDGKDWEQENEPREGQAAMASTELSEKRLPPQPPFDGEVAVPGSDTALPGSARNAAENTEETSDSKAAAKAESDWEMPGEMKESSVPLGTMQNPAEKVPASDEMAPSDEMAAGEKTQEKAEAEAGAENEVGWEMAGDTKESEVPLGTMRNPTDVSEGESRLADAIAKNSAVGVSSAEANAEAKAATKEADEKAAAEAKERAQPGWADNVERAGETKESKVPLGTMKHAWDGKGWQETPSR